MPLYQEDLDDFVKGFAKRQKDLQPTEAEQKEERRRKRQEELLAAAKTEEQTQKGFFEQAGDVVGGVGNFVKDAAISVKDDAVNSFTGIKDTIEGTLATNDQSKLQEGANNIQKKYNDEINNIYGGYIDKGAVAGDGGADESQMSKEDLDKIAAMKSAKEKELADYKEKTNYEEKSAQNDKEFDEAQAVDAKKTAGAAASTFLNVATLGAGTAVKAGGKQAITQAVKAGGKKAVAKEIAKRGGIAAAEGATFGAASGASSAAARDEDILAGATQGAIAGGVLAGGLGAGSGKLLANKAGKAQAVIDDAAKNTKVTAGAPMAGVDEVAASLDMDAKLNALSDEADAANVVQREGEFNQIMGNREIGLTDDGTAPASNGQKLLGSGTPARDIAEVDAEITALQTEGSSLPADEVKARWSALQEERKVALENDAERGFTLERDDARAQFESNGLPNELDEAQGALDEFDNGNADLPTMPDTPVAGAVDVATRENFPVELKGAAQELLDDRGVVEGQLEGLMTKEKLNSHHLQMDEAYKLREAEIAEMPAPRQELEYAKLDEKYQADLAELDEKFEIDAPAVEKMGKIKDHLDMKEQELVRQSNLLMESAPDNFRSVDEGEFMAQRNARVENLETAKRFNDPEEIVNDVATSPRPEKVVDTDPDVRQAYQAKVFEETDKIVDVPNIGGVREAMLNYTSPSKNIKALTGSDEIFSGIIRAESGVNIANKADIQVISQIAKRINGKEQASQIIDFIEGKRSTLSGFDEETAGLVREFFETKKAGLKELGIGTLDEYFPHLFNKNDPNIQRLFKSKTNADINFGNLKKRMEEGGDFNRDIVEVMAAYSRGYNRKTILEPALKPLEDVKMQFEGTKAVGEWVDGYLENLKGITDPSGAEKLFNGIVDGVLNKAGKTTGGNHYKKTLGTQRMISAVATMGINPGTAIRNMTQVVNTVAGIGVKHSTNGAIKATRAFGAGKDSPEWLEMMESGIFDGGISRHFQVDLDSELGRMNKAQNIGEKGANFMMGMIRGTDVSLRAQAYWGAKDMGLEKAIKKGLEGAEAEKFAKDFAIGKVADTQFITSAADMPVKLNGAGVRSLTQLATFSLKQAEMLGELGVKLVKKDDGTYGLNMKQAGNLLAAGTTAALLTEALKPVIGFNEKEWIPFYDQIASIVDPSSTAGESLYRSPLVSLIAGNGKGKIGLLDAVKSGDMGAFLEDNWSSIIPGGTQIKKTTEGIQTTTSGVSKNPEGKVRYLQDMGVDDTLKASLFGQYSTDAGRQWIKDGFPTLTESEMRLGSKEGSGDVTFEELPRETQKEFYDFYASQKKVTGRNDTLDAIKEAVRNGNIKKAQRLGDDYNKKATDAMKGYFVKHKGIPPELEDDMTSKLFIDVQGKIDDALDEE